MVAVHGGVQAVSTLVSNASTTVSCPLAFSSGDEGRESARVAAWCDSRRLEFKNGSVVD